MRAPARRQPRPLPLASPAIAPSRRRCRVAWRRRRCLPGVLPLGAAGVRALRANNPRRARPAPPSTARRWSLAELRHSVGARQANTTPHRAARAKLRTDSTNDSQHGGPSCSTSRPLRASPRSICYAACRASFCSSPRRPSRRRRSYFRYPRPQRARPRPRCLSGRGLHSSTCQLNVSTLCGQGPRRKPGASSYTLTRLYHFVGGCL